MLHEFEYILVTIDYVYKEVIEQGKNLRNIKTDKL